MNNVEINGIYYNLNECEKTAQVTEGPDEYSGAVSIPETVSYNGKTYTVTSIGNEAFCGCSGLTSVNIGNSVTCIGNEAFWGCSELTSVNIPGSVTNIADWAFGFCSGLTSVNIPNSVTNIGDSAFMNCSGLTSINVETGNTIYDSRNNCNAIIETATNTLITGCKNTTIPNSVTSIGDDAFWGCKGLTSINVETGNTIYDSRNNCNAIIETATNTLITGCKTPPFPTQ